LCNASRSSISTRSNSLLFLLFSSSVSSSPSFSASLSELLSLSELADSEEEDDDDSDELESEDLLLSVLDEIGESFDDSSSDSPRRWKCDRET
jgi:hypothetical protein